MVRLGLTISRTWVGHGLTHPTVPIRHELSPQFEGSIANLPPFHCSVLELCILFISEWVISQISRRVFGLALSARVASRSLRIHQFPFGLERFTHDDLLRVDNQCFRLLF